jgi:hypothetical protein
MLIPPSPDEMIDKGHPVLIVNQVMSQIEIASLLANYYKDGGTSSNHPRMLLKMMVFATRVPYSPVIGRLQHAACYCEPIYSPVQDDAQDCPGRCGQWFVSKLYIPGRARHCSVLFIHPLVFN